MDFLEYANRQQQSGAIDAIGSEMLGTEEEERERNASTVADSARHELTEVNAAMVTAKDDVVANIQDIWDFAKHINDEVADIDPNDILSELSKLRKNQEALRQRIATLGERHASASRATQFPAAAADELLRRFPALNRGNVALGEPVPEEALAEVDEGPNLLPTGQRTRRRSMNLNAINEKELLRKFPALRRG